MTPLRLDRDGVLEYQQNRDPYLFIDVAEEVIPGVSAKGFRQLKQDDWFFKVHWPSDPNMPGMLQVEALIQLCALTVLTLPGNKGKIVYVTSLNHIKLSEKVLPGDRFEMVTELHSWRRGIGQCSGTGSVRGKVACRAEFNIVVPSILEQYRVGQKSAARHAPQPCASDGGTGPGAPR